MKKALILPCFLIFTVFVTAQPTIYYSESSGSPSSTGMWHVNRNGTGTSPANFNGGNIFVVQSGHILSTSANWNVNGNSGKIIIEDGGVLKANGKTISVANFEILNGGKYIHEVSSNSFPGSSSRNFAEESTVEIRNWGSAGTALPNPVTWGNLIIDLDNDFNGNWNQAGKLTNLAGNLVIKGTGKNSSQLRLGTNQTYTLTIGGDLIIEGGKIETASGNGNNSQTFVIEGSYIQTGGTLQRSGSTHPNFKIVFDGENSQFTKTGGTLSNQRLNWEVSNGAKLILNNNLPVASSRSLQVNGVINFQNYQATGEGDFELAPEGKIITSNPLGVGGSLALTGSLDLSQTATYEFQSATTTPFASLPGNVTAKDIIVDANVTINKDVTVTGSLKLQSGKLTIPAGYTVNINSGIAVEGTGFSAGKHIVTQANHSTGAKGFLRIGNFTGTMTFPVGNGTHYLPVTLTTTGQNDFSVCAYPGATLNGQPNGAAFGEVAKKAMVDAIWMVNRNSGTGNPTMTVSWPDALEGQTFKSIPDAQIGISHYDGSNWDLPFGNGNQLQNTATRPYILSFSPFGVGKSGIPLPLKFGDIKVFQKNNGAQVDWISLTELNVDRYEIERSFDGRTFATTGQVAATGNGTAKKSYSYNDPNPGTSSVFYRIKAVDADGKHTYSTMVKLVLNQAGNDLVLYPNPAVGKRISFQLGNLPKGQYQLSVFDLNGKHVYRQSFNHNGGAISQLIELPGNTVKGIYNFRISGSGGSKTDLIKMFVVN